MYGSMNTVPSPNADFAQSVIDAGLTWIGPTPDQIRLLGDKVAAKRAAVEAGVPTTEIIEVTPGADSLIVTCVLGLERDLGPMQGLRIRMRFGEILSDDGRVTTEGPVLVAPVRFDTEAAQAITRSAPSIRDLRLGSAS